MFIEAMNSGGDGSRMVRVGRYSIYISGGVKNNAQIDCTSVPNYQNLTADDFYFDGVTTTTMISSTNQIVLNVGKSYNQNNGVLTVSYNETSVNGQQTIAFDVYAKIPSSGGSQGITIPSLTFNSSLRDTTASSYVNQSIPFDVSGYSFLTIDRLTIKDIVNGTGGSVSIIADDSTTLYSGQAVGSTSVDVSNLLYDISAYSVVKFNLTIGRYSECRTTITNIQIT